VYNAGTFTVKDGEITDSTPSTVLVSYNMDYDKYACAYGGGVYLDAGSAITKTGGTINPGSIDLRCSNSDTGGAAVFVEYIDNPVGMENAVEADLNLTITAADTAKSSLTPDKGWTE
jgi:hypothetical protein